MKWISIQDVCGYVFKTLIHLVVFLDLLVEFESSIESSPRNVLIFYTEAVLDLTYFLLYDGVKGKCVCLKQENV